MPKRRLPCAVTSGCPPLHGGGNAHRRSRAGDYFLTMKTSAVCKGGRFLTTLTVSRLTVMTWAMRRTMYCGSSGRLASPPTTRPLIVPTYQCRNSAPEDRHGLREPDAAPAAPGTPGRLGVQLCRLHLVLRHLFLQPELLVLVVLRLLAD